MHSLVMMNVLCCFPYLTVFAVGKVCALAVNALRNRMLAGLSDGVAGGALVLSCLVGCRTESACSAAAAVRSVAKSLASSTLCRRHGGEISDHSGGASSDGDPVALEDRASDFFAGHCKDNRS